MDMSFEEWKDAEETVGSLGFSDILSVVYWTPYHASLIYHRYNYCIHAFVGN